MKYLIIATWGQRIIEAEDLEDAVRKAYEDHTGYDNVQAIIKIDCEN